jgi:hypothetical protein
LSNCTGTSSSQNIVEKGGSKVANHRMTITEVADRIGVTPKTIIRWEKARKIHPSKRDWRGWRVYDKSDLKTLKTFKDQIIYEEDNNGKAVL